MDRYREKHAFRREEDSALFRYLDARVYNAEAVASSFLQEGGPIISIKTLSSHTKFKNEKTRRIAMGTEVKEGERKKIREQFCGCCGKGMNHQIRTRPAVD